MKYVVVGGTGTLGSALIRRLIADPKNTVVCVSRDELKQKNLRDEIDSPRLSFAIGDIKDKGSLRLPFTAAHAIFHVAALKHIDCVEDNPVEGVKTNIIGTQNVAELAIEKGLPFVAFSSTDKAVEPINTYGMTKAISERHLFNLNETQSRVKFSVFRWGNVIGSRGSVLHSFVSSLKERRAIDLTHPKMSRFWVDIDHAADFMIGNYKTAPKDKACIPEMKGCEVSRLADAVAEAMGMKKYKTNIVGMRKGEKLAEVISAIGNDRVTSETIAQLTNDEILAMVKPIVGAIA